MDKWEELKKCLIENKENARMKYMESTDNHSREGDMAWHQMFTTCGDVLNEMAELERKSLPEPPMAEAEREYLDKDFIMFLEQGIKAKNWESSMKRRINECTDEAEFVEGYTTALIDIKNYYKKLLKPEEK